MRTVEGEESLALVACEGGEILGSLAVEERPGAAGYLGMMVAAGWRGKGVGTALLEAGIEWARATGLRILELEVFPHNEAAIALYRKLGFVEDRRLRQRYRRRSGEVWDAIVMRLRLEPP